MNRTYTWMDQTHPISGDDISDRDVAGRIRGLHRNDICFEGILLLARDRIVCLSEEKLKLEADVLALRGLIDRSNTDVLPVSSSQAPASPNSAPRVKELVWVARGPNEWFSDNPCGQYLVHNFSGRFSASVNDEVAFFQSNKLKAQALKACFKACNKEHTRRILSALEEEL